MTTGEKTSQLDPYSGLTPAVLTDLLCIDRPNGDSYKSPLASFRTLLFGANANWPADPLVIGGPITAGGNVDVAGGLAVGPYAANANSAVFITRTLASASDTYGIQLSAQMGHNGGTFNQGGGLAVAPWSIDAAAPTTVTHVHAAFLEDGFRGLNTTWTNYYALRILTPTAGVNNFAILVEGGPVDLRGGILKLTGLPTSASGLAAGRVWSNGGVLTIV